MNRFWRSYLLLFWIRTRINIHMGVRMRPQDRGWTVHGYLVAERPLNDSALALAGNGKDEFGDAEKRWDRKRNRLGRHFFNGLKPAFGNLLLAALAIR